MTLVSRLRMAAHPDRLRILGLCAHADLTVCELAEILSGVESGLRDTSGCSPEPTFFAATNSLRGARTISTQDPTTAGWFNYWSISCPIATAIINRTCSGSKRYETRGRKGPRA